MYTWPRPGHGLNQLLTFRTYIISDPACANLDAAYPLAVQVVLSQRGDSPFVYRDRGGWPASLPYICKIRVSMAIGTQSGIRLHERVPAAKIWGSSKNDQNRITGKLLKL